MRISDWSSDVCSSDLCDAERRCPGFCRGNDDFASMRALRRPVGQTPDPAPSVRCECRCPFARGGDRAIWPAGAPLGRTSRGRSEEHTSELQSLMRISYAVFCLTKKKKLKAQHITAYQ